MCRGHWIREGFSELNSGCRFSWKIISRYAQELTHLIHSFLAFQFVVHQGTKIVHARQKLIKSFPNWPSKWVVVCFKIKPLKSSKHHTYFLIFLDNLFSNNFIYQYMIRVVIVFYKFGNKNEVISYLTPFIPVIF